ncbi:MAG: hypothetical protein M1827_001518 [Pycnora praestabilis]|nr:MAG: hypothetical protein M1827_001518 [Pycnora praestabilis]
MAPKRMTANPVKPARYRPGKPIAAEVSSEEEDSEAEEEQAPATTTAPPPKATSFPSDSAKISSNLRKVDLNERRQRAADQEAARVEAEKVARAKEEDGFVTEESEDELEGSEAEEESGSEEEEGSSEEEAPRVLLRPTFVKKDKRKAVGVVDGIQEEEERLRLEEERRKAKANQIVQDQLEKNAAARAAGKKFWDDDEDGEVDQVDDTDGLDPEAERAAWKLRELRRVKRDREKIEQAEKEREEIERRRNLGEAEREAEDRDFIARQKEENEGKGKMGYMQKYYHKGAFFQDDAKEQGLDRRDIMGSRYQDDVTNRELLPQYMQVRDMTRLGRKGGTKYKDLKSEDTGRWGIGDDRGPRNGQRAMAGITDERFMPDQQRGQGGATGANASIVKERRNVEGAPEGPRAMRDEERMDRERDGGDTYRPGRNSRDEDTDGGSRYVPQERNGERRQHSPRRRPRSRGDSRSPRSNRYWDDRDRRKRPSSPYDHGHDADKRRRVDVR